MNEFVFLLLFFQLRLPKCNNEPVAIAAATASAEKILKMTAAVRELLYNNCTKNK